MLVYAAFTPHTPLLIPSIGKDSLEKLPKTNQAMDELTEDLYVANPDTIVFLTGHGESYPDAFSINLNDPYKVDLSEFGDLTHEETYRPDLGLIDSIQRKLRQEGIPLTLHPEEVLDYGSAVPLIRFGENIKNVRIVPITYSELDAKAHFNFGQALQDPIFNSARRIAVIASGDLSHCLTSDAPAGFNPSGELFDNKIREIVSENNAAGLIKLDPELVKEAAECGYRPLLILFGILDKVNIRPIIHAYEAPFGVGYMTASFDLG